MARGVVGCTTAPAQTWELMVTDEWALASARDGLTAMNQRDWSMLDSLCAANVVYESPQFNAVGRDGLQRCYEDLVKAVPDLCGSDLQMIQNDADGNWATFTFVQTGTPLTAAPRVVGDGSRFAIRTTMFLRFDDDGLVARMHTAHG
jgi:hypothetical protein